MDVQNQELEKNENNSVSEPVIAETKIKTKKKPIVGSLGKIMINIKIPKVLWNGEKSEHYCTPEPRRERFTFSGKGTKINILFYNDFIWFAHPGRNGRYKLVFENGLFPKDKYTDEQKAEFEKIYAYAAQHNIAV